MALYQWSQTPASNASAGSINWAEGQFPSSVNDSARQMMADVAVYMADSQFYNQGQTPTYISATQFSVTGNQTAIFTVGRRVKCTVTAGIVYGSITASVYTSLTTLTVLLDSGSLDSGISIVALGILTPTNSAMPAQYAGNAATATLATLATNASALSGTASGKMPTISATMGSSAMTIAATAQWLDFRNATLGNGVPSTINAAPANLVIPATATLGTTNAVLGRQYILEMNNGGVAELAIIGSTPPSETTLLTTTTIAAASNSATTAYSTTGRTSLPFRVIGYVESTQAIAGTWVTAVSQIQPIISPISGSLLRRTVYKTAGTFIWTKVIGTTNINIRLITANTSTGALCAEGYLFSNATGYSSQTVTISNTDGGTNSFGSLITGTNYNPSGPVYPSFSGQDFRTVNINSGTFLSPGQIIVEEYA